MARNTESRKLYQDLGDWLDIVKRKIGRSVDRGEKGPVDFSYSEYHSVKRNSPTPATPLAKKG